MDPPPSDDRAVGTRIGDAWVVTLPRELAAEDLRSLRTDLLERVRDARVRALVFEASALDVIDASEFAELATVARSAAWLGLRTLIVGLSPGVVGYLIDAGVDTHAVEPFATLDDALGTVGAAVSSTPASDVLR